MSDANSVPTSCPIPVKVFGWVQYTVQHSHPAHGPRVRGGSAGKSLQTTSRQMPIGGTVPLLTQPKSYFDFPFLYPFPFLFHSPIFFRSCSRTPHVIVEEFPLPSSISEATHPCAGKCRAGCRMRPGRMRFMMKGGHDRLLLPEKLLGTPEWKGCCNSTVSISLG